MQIKPLDSAKEAKTLNNQSTVTLPSTHPRAGSDNRNALPHSVEVTISDASRELLEFDAEMLEESLFLLVGYVGPIPNSAQMSLSDAPRELLEVGPDMAVLPLSVLKVGTFPLSAIEQSLLDCLKQETEALKKLEASLAAEAAVIKAETQAFTEQPVDLQKLEAIRETLPLISRRKMSLTMWLATLGERRDALLEKLGLPKGSEGTRQAAQAAKPPLIKAWNSVEQLSKHVVALNNSALHRSGESPRVSR